MQYEIDRADDVGGEPSLAEMTALAIRILSRNPNGYFLVVEGATLVQVQFADGRTHRVDGRSLLPG